MIRNKKTAVQLSRRQLFSGHLKRSLPYRPPWAVSEVLFDNTCTNCGDCIEVCPLHILSFGRGRLPVIDFSQNECTFCGECEAVCEVNALQKKADQAVWDLSIEIKPDCLSINRITCRSCGDHCNYDAIQFRLELGGKATPIISAENCMGCGACIAICPNQSIKITRKTRQ